jgi:hypothetical protein
MNKELAVGLSSYFQPYEFFVTTAHVHTPKDVVGASIQSQMFKYTVADNSTTDHVIMTPTNPLAADVILNYLHALHPESFHNQENLEIHLVRTSKPQKYPNLVDHRVYYHVKPGKFVPTHHLLRIRDIFEFQNRKTTRKQEDLGVILAAEKSPSAETNLFKNDIEINEAFLPFAKAYSARTKEQQANDIRSILSSYEVTRNSLHLVIPQSANWSSHDSWCLYGGIYNSCKQFSLVARDIHALCGTFLDGCACEGSVVIGQLTPLCRWLKSQETPRVTHYYDVMGTEMRGQDQLTCRHNFPIWLMVYFMESLTSMRIFVEWYKSPHPESSIRPYTELLPTWAQRPTRFE